MVPASHCTRIEDSKMTTHNIDVASTLRQISDAMPSLPPLGESDKELFQACASGDVDQVRSLLADGADANAKQPTTRTSVLMAAADLGNAGVAAELLATRSAKGKAKNAVLIRDRDVRGRNAFMVAAEAGHLDILKMILDSFDEMDDPVETTEDGSPPDERVDYVDEQDYQGRTALMLACRGPEDRVIEVVNWLLSDEGGNAAINLQDADGRTVSCL